MSYTLSGEYKNRAKRSEKISYEEWLREKSPDIGKEYYRSLSLSAAKAAASSPDRGSERERVYGMGLSKSGYAEYLRSLGESAKERAVSNAASEKRLDTLTAIKDYRDYERMYDENQKTIGENVVKMLTEKRIFDENTAIKLMIDEGMNLENSEHLVKEAVSNSRKENVLLAIKYIVARGMSSYAARKYARSLGLPEDDVAAVLDGANRLSEEEIEKYSSMSPEEYLKEIKNRKD